MNKRSFWIFLLYFWHVPIFLGHNGPFFRQISVEQGMPSAQIHDIQVDQNGFVWVGTNNGLVRITGMGFDQFTVEDGLSNSNIKRLVPAKAGAFWILSNGALARFANGQGQKLDSLPAIGQLRMHYAVADSTGGLWASRKDWTYLLHIDAEHRVQKVLAGTDPKQAGQIPLPLFTDPNGSVWAYAKQQMLIFRDDRIQRNYSLPNQLKGLDEVTGTLREDGMVFIGGEQNVLMLNPATSEWDAILPASVWDYSQILTIVAANERLWLGTDNGVWCLQQSPNGWKLAAQWLEGRQINSILLDHEQNLWLGTEQEGVYMANAMSLANMQEQSTVTHLRDRLKLGEGERISLICAQPEQNETLILSNKGAFWLLGGPSISGPIRLKGKLTPDVDYLPEKVLGIGDNQYIVLAKGKLWLLDKGEAQILHGLEGRRIQHISLTPGGDLLLVDRIGLIFQEPISRIQSLLTEPSSSKQLSTSTQNAMILPGAKTAYMDATGTVWVGMDNGLQQVPAFPADSGLQMYPDNVFLQGGVQDMLLDEHGNLWMATEGSGLLVMNARNPGSLRVVEEFKRRNCQLLHYYSEGNLLWVVTPEGLAYMPLDSVTEGNSSVQWVSHEDGLVNGKIEAISWETPRLYVASDQATQIIDWSQLPPLEAHPRTYLSALVQGDSSFVLNQDIVVAQGDGSVEISWATSNYLGMWRQRFEYQVEGVYNNWISIGQNKVQIPALSAGLYTFRVRQINYLGEPSRHFAELKFRVRPVFYLTWWFKTLFVLCISGILLLGVRYYFLNMQRRDLKQKVEEKTRTLNEKVSVLNRINKDLEQYAYAASHDLKTPLRNVITHLQLLERTYGRELEPGAHEYIELAVSSAKEMHVMIDDLLTYAQVGQVLEWESFSVDEVLKEVTQILSGVISEKNGIIHAPTLPVVKGVKLHWRLLFQNLLHNGLKFNYASQPEIHIAFRDSLDFWIFSISDNGIGIDPEYTNHIFDLFHRLDKVGFEGTGLGLAICKKVIDMHGGHIWVESRPGEGATFLFSIPKDPARVVAKEITAEL